MFLERNFIGYNSDFKSSRIVLFGAPFDCTVSYRAGSRFAPSAIRNESFCIETYSPYLDKDLADISAHDAGDLDVVFGNSQKTLKLIERFADKVFSSNKIPFLLGGEHLVSLASIKSAFKKFPDLRVIHFDAHTDLREDYLGEKLSHACVIRRVWDILGDERIYQFGIRSGEKNEFEWAKKHTRLTKFNFYGLEECIKELKGYPVYLSVDIDVLDTSVLTGTGTPEAGGVTFLELLEALKTVSYLNIIGCDLTELAPNIDQSGASTALACKLVREMTLNICK